MCGARSVDARLVGSSASGTLLFNRYGSTYYLSKVWPAGSKEAQATPKTAREKELAQQIGQPGTMIVALQTK